MKKQKEIDDHNMKHLKLFLVKYAKDEGYETDDDSIMNMLNESPRLHQEVIGSHSWYEDIFAVVEIDGVFIGFNTYNILTESVHSLKLNIDSVQEMEEKESKLITYVKSKFQNFY